MKKILVSNTLSAEEIYALSSFGEVFALPSHAALPSPISSHPDTLFALVAGKLFTYPDYSEGVAMLNSLGIPFQTVGVCAGKTYPDDAALNCFEINGTVFGRKKSLAKEITAAAKSVCDVKQGYAHCSTAVFDGGIISADGGICRAAEANGINCLKISPGGVVLDGYNCGFVGGACGQIGNNAVFFGDVTSHPDGEKIIGFAENAGLNVVCLSEGALHDRGGIIVL